MASGPCLRSWQAVPEPGTDWLARKVGGVIDFRLENDPREIPPYTLRKRREAYLRQLHAQMTSEKLTRCARHPAADWRHYFGTHDED